jgi:hypothetical protein
MYAYNYLPVPNSVGNDKEAGYHMYDYPKRFKEQGPTGFFQC